MTIATLTSPPADSNGADRAAAPAVARHPLDTHADDVVRVLRDDGSLDPADDPRLPAADVVALYQAMLRVRLLDDRLVALQRQGRIGFHIGSLGEEASILGSAFAMRPQDWIFPCYREFGAALWRGMPLTRYVDNMFGNANDPAKGRQMPDHYCSRQAKFLSISSPIGTQITQAVGFAWAARIKKDDLCTLAYFGEGATSSNEFHNGLNFAGVFKTPCVLFCRNNGWAISVPTERQTASETFAIKGEAYGIPGVRCDGNDVFAVYTAVKQAVERARRGEGATMIESLTYRVSAHTSSDDPSRYRDESVTLVWRTERDPIARFRTWLIAEGHHSEAADEALRAELDAEVRAAVAAEEKVGNPPIRSIFTDVYAELPPHLQEQAAELEALPRQKSPHVTH